MRRSQRRNAVTALGHFLSWAAEFAIIVMAVLVNYVVDINAREIIVFVYPSLNLVIFPLIQMMASPLLRAEARKFFGKMVPPGLNSQF